MTGELPPARRGVYDHAASVSTQNHRGEWVPAIPMPLMATRLVCGCGKKFWTVRGYQGHYALEHILGL